MAPRKRNKTKIQGSKTNDADAPNITRGFIASRKNAHHRKAREAIDLKLREIQEKAEKTSDHDPMYPMRPYGLGEDMQGHRVHIWDLILVHVHDLKTIASLRDVCMMFRDFLERKYKAAMLPEVIAKCLDTKIISWKSSRTEKSNWVKTLQDLRAVSKATKNSVDLQFHRGMLGYEFGADEAEWFSVHTMQNTPNYRTEEWKIPTLMLGALDTEQARLNRILDTLANHEAKATLHSFPMKAVIFNERREDDNELPLNLRDLRNMFQKCLKKIGNKITSFRYKTGENYIDTYNILRRWVALMPNLEELMVDFTGYRRMIYAENVGTFPKCRKLKRFAEGPQGFGYPFINKIVEANPKIEEVLLGQIPSTELEMNNLNQVLGTLPLTKLHCTTALTIPFFEQDFQWVQTLTGFAFLDKRTEGTPHVHEIIPSDKLFRFLCKCRNLKILGIMTPCIRDTGGYLHLPLLETVYLRILPGFKSLRFLEPVEKLEQLCLETRACPDLDSGENVMQFLEDYHIPSIFPAMKEIYVDTDTNGYENVWRA